MSAADQVSGKRCVIDYTPILELPPVYLRGPRSAVGRMRHAAIGPDAGHLRSRSRGVLDESVVSRVGVHG